MEEILASIRRIIAEDSDAPAAASAGHDDEAPVEAPVLHEAPEEEDVLDLTQVIHEPPPPPPAPPPSPAPLVAVPTTASRLVSEHTAASAGAAFASLARKKAPTADIPIGNGALTLEQMVRDLVTPMLKDWLEANLPSVVERIVQDEVRRISAQQFG